LESHLESVVTSTEYLTLLSSITTDTAALASITAFEASVSNELKAGHTLGIDYLNGLSSGIRPFFASVVSEQSAILANNVFTNLPTATSTGAAPRETGGLKVTSALAVGFVGAVMAL
jgi:hypothetical protein